MKYPRIPEKFNRNRRLPREKISQIKTLHQFGDSSYLIAKKVGVARTTVMKYTSERFAKWCRDYHRQYSKDHPKPIKLKKEYQRRYLSKLKSLFLQEYKDFYKEWRRKHPNYFKDYRKQKSP